MPTPIPPIVAYELVFKPGIAQIDGVRGFSLEYIHVEAHHAGGEPFKMVYENDGLWHQRLADIFGDAEALAVMTQIELGETAKIPGTYTRETLKALKFHKDYLKIA